MNTGTAILNMLDAALSAPAPNPPDLAKTLFRTLGVKLPAGPLGEARKLQAEFDRLRADAGNPHAAARAAFLAGQGDRSRLAADARAKCDVLKQKGFELAGTSATCCAALGAAFAAALDKAADELAAAEGKLHADLGFPPRPSHVVATLRATAKTVTALAGRAGPFPPRVRCPWANL